MQKDIQRTQIISADISCIVTACFQNKASCAYRCCCLPSVLRAVFSALSSLELIQERPLLSQADLFFNSAGFLDLAVYINIAPPPRLAALPTYTSVGRTAGTYVKFVCIIQIPQVLDAIQLSHATFNKIRQNLWWAFGYNLVGIPLAAGALLPSMGIALTPSISGTAFAPPPGTPRGYLPTMLTHYRVVVSTCSAASLKVDGSWV